MAARRDNFSIAPTCSHRFSHSSPAIKFTCCAHTIAHVCGEASTRVFVNFTTVLQRSMQCARSLLRFAINKRTNRLQLLYTDTALFARRPSGYNARVRISHAAAYNSRYNEKLFLNVRDSYTRIYAK